MNIRVPSDAAEQIAMLAARLEALPPPEMCAPTARMDFKHDLFYAAPWLLQLAAEGLASLKAFPSETPEGGFLTP